MKLSKESTNRLTKWSGQLGVPLEDLQEKFEAKIVALTEQLKDQEFSEKDIEKYARKQFASDIRPGKSRAETYEGVVLGFGPLKDWNEFFFRIAKKEFENDALQARLSGITDEYGNALITQEIFEKKGQYFKGIVGGRLEHEYERHVLAVGRPVIHDDKSEKMKMFYIKLGGEPAQFNEKFPAPKPGLVARWRCNVQEVNDDLNFVRANGATVTTFEEATYQANSGPLTGVLEAKKCAVLLNRVQKDMRSSLEDLGDWIDANAKNKGRFAVVEAEILQVFKSSIQIGDADQLDIEDIPTMYVALDERIVDNMFYGENSTVLVATMPYRRKKKTRDGNVYTEVKDKKGQPIKEVVANGIAIFPLIAAPKAAPKAAPAVPADQEISL